jgi:endogenous inhibitor of DNA gyrase (YacG/DUF329 family)
MIRRSLLSSSGQLWKLYLSLILIILGGVLLLVAGMNTEQLTPGSGFLLVFGAFSLMAIGLLGGGLSVRCPKCGAKLLWKAISEAPASRWLHWLVTLSECPVCGHNHPGTTEGSTVK